MIAQDSVAARPGDNSTNSATKKMVMDDSEPNKIPFQQPQISLTESTSQPSAGQPLVVAGKFKIGRLLGQGGMSAVYEAEDQLLKRKVAIKFLLTGNVVLEPGATRRFQREAQAASALVHENICAVKELSVDETGRQFMVMDFIDGQSLSDLIKAEGGLSLNRALALAQQIVRGLAHAHKHSIVHRDVKPSNVMITTSDGAEIVKIVDFGIARMLVDDLQSRVTRTGETVGTPHYMSPEQALGEITDARADIYSFGCMLYEMLSGSPPFLGDNHLAVMTQHLHKDMKPLDQAGLPSGMNDFLSRCLAKKPAERYSSFEEVGQDLEKLIAGEPTGLRTKRNRGKNKAPLLLGLSLALIVVLAVGVALGPTLISDPQPTQHRAATNLPPYTPPRSIPQKSVPGSINPNIEELDLLSRMASKGDLDVALKTGLVALATAERQHQPPKDIGTLMFSVADLYYKQGKYKKAAFYYDQLLSLQGFDMTPSARAVTLQPFAVAELESGDTKSALGHAMDAISICQSSESTLVQQNMGSLQALKGKIYYMSGEFQDAADSFESARRFYLDQSTSRSVARELKTQHKSNAITCLWYLSLCNLAMNELSKANTCFEEYSKSVLVGSKSTQRKNIYKQLAQLPPPRVTSLLASGPQLSGTLDGSANQNDAEVFRRVGDYFSGSGKERIAEECAKRADQLASGTR